MQFQQLTLNQTRLINQYFGLLKSKTCDYTIGGMFMWRDFYKMEYATKGEAVFTRLNHFDNNVFYNLPLSRDIPGSLKVLLEEAKENGEELIRFCTVPEEYVEFLSKNLIHPQITEETHLADYLYATSDLAYLKGRKYSGQRNLISQFKRNVDSWRFVAVDSSNIDRVIDYYHSWSKAGLDMSDFAREENRMVGDVLENLSNYGMFGGVLEADEQVIGFSFGEIVNDTLFVHIEKAEHSFKGAYQMIVNQFAHMYGAEKTEYINREEDMGDPGLRSSKQSYHPVRMLKKYTVIGKPG